MFYLQTLKWNSFETGVPIARLRHLEQIFFPENTYIICTYIMFKKTLGGISVILSHTIGNEIEHNLFLMKVLKRTFLQYMDHNNDEAICDNREKRSDSCARRVEARCARDSYMAMSGESQGYQGKFTSYITHTRARARFRAFRFSK